MYGRVRKMSKVVVKDEMLERCKHALYPEDPEEDLHGMGWEDVITGMRYLLQDHTEREGKLPMCR